MPHAWAHTQGQPFQSGHCGVSGLGRGRGFQFPSFPLLDKFLELGLYFFCKQNKTKKMVVGSSYRGKVP